MAYKYQWCEHCNELFWAKRSTAKFCSAKCRVAHNRNQPKPIKMSMQQQQEQLLETIAFHNPKAFEKLAELRNQKGLYALNLALTAIADILQDKS